MKQAYQALLAAAVMTAAVASASAEGLKIDGEICAGKTRSISAPFTGTVLDYDVKAGENAAAGDVLFTLNTGKICAATDGVIRGVFAQNGDEAQNVLDRYGALCYIERDELFTAVCTSSGSDSDVENKFVHPGETVYLKSTASSDRKGTGRVTKVGGGSYTVEVTDEDDLRYNEQVKIYREKSCSSESCIGSGRLSGVEPVPVTAEGSILRVCVREGQRVSRGDVLFETVSDALEGYADGQNAVVMPEDGIVLSVDAVSGTQMAKDSVLAVYCPADSLEMVCPADEDDLSAVNVGGRVRIVLDAYPDEAIEGTITQIAAAADEEGSTTFDVTIVPEESELLRIGLKGSIEL